ncbi:MAG: phenylalanine--tRNA ligase subunit beta [Candidatus Gastranaerophilales bacterium]|nr:phenylalanine--tRNA ligase subunit beta [Candidatus Gastranaerophilales bacterium]
MQISLEWLNEFIDLSDVSAEQVAHELTMSGLEVEEIETIGPKFSNIITAKIVDIKQHPNADKLHLVDVNTGSSVKTVVCGGQNIEIGQIIPYASVGSKVLDRKTGEQFELTPATIRGIESQGMLCSQDELGLNKMQEEDGILILNHIYDDLQLGQPLENIVNIKEDKVLYIAPTANRGDEMSVIGVARELSSLFNKKMSFSKLEATQDFSTNDFSVEIKDEDVCKYYSAGLLKDVKIKPSPAWMQRRLEVSGIRAINNVVDITNYVLLEYGQPLHAFDMDKLDGYLCVRRAEEGEKIITLDGIERSTTNDTVLIADKDKGVCVGGVFGGENSEIDDNSKNIVLESAYFTPASNRKSARSIGYRSEACARFERGVDIESVKPALLRAMQLMVELADAKVDGIVETGKNELEPIEITLRFNQIKRILGCEIEPKRCIEILDKLGFELIGKNELAAKFRVPSFRINDVTREIDLIEEIARINGYDKIAPTLPRKTQSPEIREETKLLKKINDLFLGYGFDESITSSLIGEPILKQYGLNYDKDKAVCVMNPQSEDHTMLRQTVIANLLQTTKSNFDNGQKTVWLYEMGKVFFKENETTKIDSGVVESRMLSGVISGDIHNSLWIKNAGVDFYTLKGVIESLLGLLGLENRVKINPADDCSYLHPGRCAKLVLLGKTPKTVGYFGQLYPILKDKMKLQQDLFLFEINLEELLSAVSLHTVRYKKLPQFPSVQRDIAFAIKEDVSHEKISNVIKKSANNKLIKGSDLFDIYQGEHIEEGFKSLAFRITLQDESATLTDEVIEKEVTSIKAGLAKNFSDVKFR